MPLFLGIPFESVLMFIVFTRICRIEFNKIKIIITFMLISLILVPVSNFILISDTPPLLWNTAFLIFTTLAAYSQTGALKLSAFFAIFSNIIYMLAGLATSSAMYPILTFLVGDVGRYVVLGNAAAFFIFNLIAFLLAFVLANKAGKLLHRRMILLDDAVKNTMASYLLIGAATTSVAFYILIFFSQAIAAIAGEPLAYTMALAVCFTLLVFLMLSFEAILRREMELRYKNQSLENLRNHVSGLEETRRFRHDHENLMLGFFNHINNKDIDNILAYYNKYMVSFHESANAVHNNMATLENLSTPELRGILSHKLSLAQHLGVNVSVDISEDLSLVDSDCLVDVCRIVGVLTDNSVEACRETEQPVFRVGALSKGLVTLFVFENTYANIPDLDKIKKAGYTTKGDARGLGLYTASQIVKSNPNLALTTRIDGGFFVQILSVLPQ
ncbi:MAG: GHKL domain-containing protein [Defluviitaleaceae bacterium]|nr:GHKL domain-containing protein [Defluviitaleaceae bacterium]